MDPKYPLYIPSKGRYKARMTSRALHRMGIPHYIVVEPDEHDAYAAAVDDSATLLVLDQKHKDDYETWPGDTAKLDPDPENASTGSGAARNFIWDHSQANGDKFHWIMDDNIRTFYRLTGNFNIPLADGTGFRCMEDFAERYTNVVMAGPNYDMFVPRKIQRPPFITNTRIYSCNLIRNDVPYRWRCRYNEDTDLSLRILKDGLCTVQFNAFLQQKMPTQTTPGGNTDEFYAAEGTLPKSKQITMLHPDVSTVVWKFGRWHHHVDYRPFRRNKLQRRPDLVLPDGADEYGMKLERRVDGEWSTL